MKVGVNKVSLALVTAQGHLLSPTMTSVKTQIVLLAEMSLHLHVAPLVQLSLLFSRVT